MKIIYAIGLGIATHVLNKMGYDTLMLIAGVSFCCVICVICSDVWHMEKLKKKGYVIPEPEKKMSVIEWKNYPEI